jgi:NADPH:quinone reductase-like Zn-dependent oxidoreductase
LNEAVTLPNNFVTVFHSVTADLGMELPWPKPENYEARDAKEAILIWGGSSSVGQYALQILKYYGYSNLIATASPRHHEKLKKMGAKWTFDYNDPQIVSLILNTAASQDLIGSNAGVPLILDCIGSKDGSIKPISKIAKSGSKVAILLPVIVKDSTETEAPEYEMDVRKAADWNEGVDARGVRTHFHLEVS